jgi:UDP-N-acetylglucosamine acyltransferase
MTNIHHTAVIHENAKLGPSVKVGPFCTVGQNVVLQNGVELISHVCVDGKVVIGENSKIYPFVTIGLAPQDLKYQDEDSEVIIGKHTTIREYVTIHRGTVGGIMKTVVGDHCLFMVGVHIAHDCVIGNNVVMANNATLGGHVVVGDYTIIGGLAAVHQFVRIGEHVIIGGLSGVEKDVIPYGNVMGKRARLVGVNLVGMKRRNFVRSEINAMRSAFEEIFGREMNRNKKNSCTFDERLSAIEKEYAKSAIVKNLVKFLNADSQRSICMPEWMEEEKL